MTTIVVEVRGALARASKPPAAARRFRGSGLAALAPRPPMGARRVLACVRCCSASCSPPCWRRLRRRPPRPTRAAASAPTELRLRNEIAIEGVLRYRRTVKVTRGTWNLTPDRYRFRWFRNETEIPGARRQTYRLGVADVGQRIKARVYVKKRGYEWAQATARADSRVGYRVPVRRTVTYRIETRGRIIDKRPRVRPPRRPDVRRPARLAQRRRRLQAGQRPLGLLPGAGRGELAAAVLERVQRAVELPRRPLRGDQPDPVEVRLAVVERRRQEPARLPPPRGQPRDRPLARPRPPRLPRSAAGSRR